MVSSRSAKRKRPLEDDPIRRPFDPKLIARAKVIAAKYQITLRQEEGHWFAVGVEEPSTYGDGRTVAQAIRDVREALTVVVAYHLEKGEPVAVPLIDQERRGRRRAG